MDPTGRYRTITNVFRISVDGPKCAILITNDSPEFDHFECGSDGDDSYFIALFSTNQSPQLKAPDNKATAEFSPGPFPTEMALACYIWQVYASASYYSSVTNGLVQPIGYICNDAVRKRVRINARWEASPDAPHLPKYVEEFFRSKWYQRVKAARSKRTICRTMLSSRILFSK